MTLFFLKELLTYLVNVQQPVLVRTTNIFGICTAAGISTNTGFFDKKKKTFVCDSQI